MPPLPEVAIAIPPLAARIRPSASGRSAAKVGWAPITIGGTFTSPRPGVDVGEVVKQGGLAAIVGAVAAPVAALFAFVDPGLAEDANCGQFIASAR